MIVPQVRARTRSHVTVTGPAAVIASFSSTRVRRITAKAAAVFG